LKPKVDVVVLVGKFEQQFLAEQADPAELALMDKMVV
jgi:hypothetical protein